MSSIILGVDISKEAFDVALLINNKVKTKKFNNNQKGFSDLKQWLKGKEVHTAHACMEATGGYEAKLAQYLYDHTFKVSVINPARIKGFSMSQLSRVKTDKADCQLIAQFCQAMQPDLWQPKPIHIQKLQQWVNRLDTLIANKFQESNRLEDIDPEVAVDIQSDIDFINERIKK
jgi:transposase